MRISTLQDFDHYTKLAKENPSQFWSTLAKEYVWKSPWSEVMNNDMSGKDIRWFEGGELNITENCLDRYVDSTPNKTAILWEPNGPNDTMRTFTYKELLASVNQTANALKELGIKKGDRVCIYLPMVPELVISLLACARIGAVHSVVFAGFSAKSLADRINDSECKLLITADGSFRGKKVIDLNSICHEAVQNCNSIENILILKHTDTPLSCTETDVTWWHDIVPKQDTHCEATAMKSEDPLFILYTSGSTGKPKGIVHTTGGYMVYAGYSFENAFQYAPDDIFWCTADVGWITGHTYITYGPLLKGATQVMFEGVPTFPDSCRFWQVIEKYKVNQFYTAPTAIRSLMKTPVSEIAKYDLSSLKVLGSVGEPINREAYDWYYEVIGNGKCPITDTWWQTETGGIMIATLPGVYEGKPTFATYPLPGIQPAIMSSEGEEITENNIEGRLCIKAPWPSMARTIYGNHQRFLDTYYSSFENRYFSGDGAKRDTEGRYRITGRVDDVIIVSGHNIGTAEIEDALNLHENVNESAVVGFPHNIKGQGIYVYVRPLNKDVDHNQLRKELVTLVRETIGPIASPDKMQIVTDLPKTRSGKIMRRILRKIAENEFQAIGDTSTLLNPDIVEEIINGAV